MSVLLKMKPLLYGMYEEMSELYEENVRYKGEVEGLRGEVERLRGDVERLRGELERVLGGQINDESYSSEATAAPRSQVGITRHTEICTESSEICRESSEDISMKEDVSTETDVFNFGKDTMKNVVIPENEKKCADRKEYFKVYRLKQKELKASKNK